MPVISLLRRARQKNIESQLGPHGETPITKARSGEGEEEEGGEEEEKEEEGGRRRRKRSQSVQSAGMQSRWKPKGMLTTVV